MPKIFYTERDIADLAARGVTSLEVTDDVVLTDLARDEALKRGVKLTRPSDICSRSGSTPRTTAPMVSFDSGSRNTTRRPTERRSTLPSSVAPS